MSFYKLDPFRKIYINPQGIKILIIICLQIICTWSRKLGYVYKYIQKSRFIDRHKQFDIVENCSNFLKIIKELKP